jgi:hypothetical protein
LSPLTPIGSRWNDSSRSNKWYQSQEVMGSNCGSVIVREGFLGHNAAPCDRFKKSLGGRDVEVYKKFEFVSLNTNWF